jgi:hypothetical protein
MTLLQLHGELAPTTGHYEANCLDPGGQQLQALFRER